MFCGESPAPETQQELPLGALAAGQLSRQGLSPVASARAAGRHLLLLLDAMARYNDLNDWQLGDVLFEDGRTVIAIFASATAAGQATPPPYRRPPASPARDPHFLVDSVRCAMGRLFAAARRSWRSSPAALPSSGTGGHGRHPPGRAAVATWPEEVQALAPPPLVGIPADFWAAVPRLSRDLTPSLQLTGVISTRAFRALAVESPTGPSARAAETPLFSDRAACSGKRRRRSSTQACRDPLVMQALRHASARSDGSYILESAKLTAVAAAPRMPPPGRAAGAARCLGYGPREYGPPLGVLGALGTRLASGVAPVGWAGAAKERLPHPPLAAVRLLTDDELAATFLRMFALPAGTVPSVLNLDVPDRAQTPALPRTPSTYLARSQATPQSIMIGPRSGRPSASPSRGSSSSPGARQTRIAAWPSPRGRGRFSAPQLPGPGYVCGTPRSATSRASRSW